MSQSYGTGEMSKELAPQSDSTKPSVSSGQIPDLLKIGSLPSDVQMDVDTDVLDPIVQNDTFVRFVLQNKGMLHSHSKIQVGYTTAANPSFLPLNIGIASLFQRATLRVGNQTLCEIDDFSNFTCYRSMFMSGESMKERLPYLTGQQLAKRISYCDEGEAWNGATPPAAVSTVFGGGGSSHMSRGLSLDNGREMYNEPGVDKPVASLDMPEWSALQNGDAIFNELPTWQFALDDLFPFLKTNQLPLYMMKEQISLEFVLHSATSGKRGFSTLAGATLGAISLDTSKTKMFADYIYYPQEMMVSYASANPNLQFSYVDYRLSKLTFDAATTSQQIRNIGGAGRIVSKIVWGFGNDSQADNDNPLISFNAQGLDRTAGISAAPPIAPDVNTIQYTNNTFSQNVKMNNGFLYPIDVDNVARAFHNVVQAEGLTPYTTREEYSNQGVSLTPKTIQTFPQNLLASQFYWNACRLNRGERVNSRGIELYYKMNALPAGTNYVLRAYLETIKFATLKNGFVQTMLA